MKPVAAIVEPAQSVEHHAAAVDRALRNYRDANKHAEQAEERATTARGVLAQMRLELGWSLAEARKLFPTTGRNAGGWSRFVADRGINMDVALDAMKYAGWVDENMPDRKPSDELPTREQAGLEKGRQSAGALPVGHRDVKPANITEADVLALLDQFDQDARGRIMRSLRSKQGRENEGDRDRDAYCTPPQITAALPEVDFDPCSNPRSTVRARRSIQLERGENGLEVAWEGSGFWNIPYSKPLPWAEKFERERAAITMAGWLVNEDHSPQWWHLITQTLPIRLDFDERLEFVPPPGVPTSKNDRPQTLLMDAPFWAGCDQAALLAMGKLWVRADHAQEFARTTTALRIVR